MFFFSDAGVSLVVAEWKICVIEDLQAAIWNQML